MKTTSTKMLITLAIACTALLGGWIVTRSHAAADTAGTKQQDDELQLLLSARFESATKALRLERAKLDAGKSTTEALYQSAQRVLEAELALNPTTEGRVAALTKHVDVMRQFEEEALKRVERGILPMGEDETPRYWRLSAEIELLRLKRTAKAAK
jgi:hypothetical protein